MASTPNSPSKTQRVKPAFAYTGGRKTLPTCYQDISTWPSFDDSMLSGVVAVRYRRLRDATVAYLDGRAMSDVVAIAGVGERRYSRIWKRCFLLAEDGKILGCRAFAKGYFSCSPIRVAPLPSAEGGKGGFSGAFRQLLRNRPGISKRLIEYLNGYGLKGLRPNRLMFRSIHKAFLRFCVEEGVTADEYPFNTGEKARRPLREWIDTDYMPQYATRFITVEHGAGAGSLAGYGEGDGQANRKASGYGAWVIDEHTPHFTAKYIIPNNLGDWESVKLRRFSVLRLILIRPGVTANLAHRQVYAAQVSTSDVCQLLWDGVNGPEPVRRTIEGLKPEEGAGYPAVVIEGLRFAIPSVVYLDNALAHLADDVQHVVAHLFGGKVILGKPYSPHGRPDVESKFALESGRIEYQIPGSTGSGPKDSVRESSDVPVDRLVHTAVFEQLMDVYCMNENALPSAGAHNISSLERLRRQLASGALKPAYLAADKRKPHFFSRPVKVTIKADTSNGRRPYFNFKYQRYTSSALSQRFDLKNKTMYVRRDSKNLRTVFLYFPDGTEFGAAQVIGHWGTFPHDERIRLLFGKLKRDGLLDVRADDRPLEALFNHLRKRAPMDRTDALRLTNLVEYLTRQDFEMSMDMTVACHEWKELSAVSKTLGILPARTLESTANDGPVHKAGPIAVKRVGDLPAEQTSAALVQTKRFLLSKRFHLPPR
jgi:putative transposase